MKLVLPKLSATMEEGRIVAWIAKEGAPVKEGSVLYEVETDKATLEVESTVSGVLDNIFVREGELIAVGTPVCSILSDAEPQAGSSPASAEAEVQPAGEKRISVPESKDMPARIKSSPSARRMARMLQVNLEQITGTGPNGRIRNRDIEEAASRGKITVQRPPSIPDSVAATNEIPRMRRAIAQEMVRSLQTIPAFWVERWVQAERLLQWKDIMQQSRNSDENKLTVTDFLLQAVGLALKETPSVNRRWISNGTRTYIEDIPGTNVGLAIGMDDGIVAPIIADVGESSLFEIAKQRSSLIEAARNRKQPVEAESAAITLSNLGSAGVDRFRAIVKPDESMILAVGRLEEKVVPVNGEITVQKGFSMILSADHRVVDGMEAAKFLGRVASIIEGGNWQLR